MSDFPKKLPPSGGQSDDDAKVAARASAPRAVKPGVVSVASDEAARFDARIAEKRSRAASIGSESSTNNNNSSAASSLAQLERDVTAKQRSANPGPPASRPGAVSVARGDNGLSSFEADVMGKMPARAMRASEEASREADDNRAADPVAAKIRRDAAARSELGNLEDRMAAKMRSAGPPSVLPSAPVASSTATAPGASSRLANEELSRLEGRILAKTAAANTPSASSSIPTQFPRVPAPGTATLPIPADVDAKLAGYNVGSKPVARKEEDYDDDMEEEDDEEGKIMQPGDVDEVDAIKKGQIDFDDPLADPNAKGKDEYPEQAPGGTVTGVALNDQGQVITTDLEFGAFVGLTGNDNDLAVAMPVEEIEDDQYIPAAVEYDPDAKPPIFKDRRFRLYACLAISVFVLVAVGAVVILLVLRKDAPPTHPRLKIGIREKVESVIGVGLLNNTFSPYTRALNWITFDDELELVPEDRDFMQRYIAAYFYFATSVDRPWATCSPPMPNQTDACDLQWVSSVEPYYWGELPSARWLTKHHVCDWAGMKCDEAGEVVVIDLAGNNLTGPYPEGVKYFPFLKFLAMSWGSLRGTLPKDLVNLKHLIDVEINTNDFTGTIPEAWMESPNLQRINVGENDLTGTIPTEIQKLDIKGFYIFENRITGTIPTEIGALASTSYFRIHENQLTGTIPTEFGVMSSGLNVLWLHYNKFTGALPSELGQLSTLTDFRVHNNPVGGTIPDELWALDIDRLDMYNCNFTGTISPLIGQNTVLGSIRLANNYFYGPIPEELGVSTGLGQVWLNGNDFTGTMPQSVCNLRGDLGLNQLQADCLPESRNGPAEVDCSDDCCTLCCDSEGDNCRETFTPEN